MMVTLENVQQWLLGDGLHIIAVIALALLTRWLLRRTIVRVVRAVTDKSERKQEARPERPTAPRDGTPRWQSDGLSRARQAQRVSTLGSLLNSIVTFVVGLVAGLTVMAIIGIPLGPLLASAGVGGVAIGFGAQSLVRDFLSGIFMMFEDQYGVGDVIDTGAAIGTVEEVGLRVTQVRDSNGVIWYIRNGEIVRIGNRSQGWSIATLDTTVPYAVNTEQVIGIIEDVAREYGADTSWSERLLEEPRVVGVESIAGSTVTIRTVARCAPNESGGVQRELRWRIKQALDAAGIEPAATGGD